MSTPKLKSIVIYFCPNSCVESDTKDCMWLWGDNGISGYIRTEIHKNKSASSAIFAAKPRPGETVLNAVEL